MSKHLKKNSKGSMFYFIIFFFTTKMAFLSDPVKRRNSKINGFSSNSALEGGRGREPQEVLPDPHAKSKIRARGGVNFDVCGKQQVGSAGAPAAWGGGNERKPTKLLLNVNVQNSLGPVKVVVSPEKSVEELIKAVVEIYVREKRRPLLASSDPRSFELHYSPFSLQGLKPEEKLKNLASRNFLLRQRLSNAVGSSCVKQAKTMAESPFPLTKLMDFLL